MKLERQPSRTPILRAGDALKSGETPDAGTIDLRKLFPRLLEDALRPLVEDDNLKPHDVAVDYGYLLPIAEYFGKAMPFSSQADQEKIERLVKDVLRLSADGNLNSPHDVWVDAFAFTRAYVQVFPGSRNKMHLTTEAFSRQLSDLEKAEWETDIGSVPYDVETAIELISIRPDLRTQVETIIRDNQVFQQIWNARQELMERHGGVMTVKCLAEICLIWPRAREFFQFQPYELERIVQAELTRPLSRSDDIKLFWSVAVLTSEHAWIDEQGKVHIPPPRSKLAPAQALPARDLTA